MIFRRSVIIFLTTLVVPILLGDDNGEYFGAIAGLRPVLFRSEFVSHGTLNNLLRNCQKIGYDCFGYPEFSPIIKRDLRFFETELAHAGDYARRLNKEHASYVIGHPETFHPDTIAEYKQGIYKNPKLVDGSGTEWHHGRKGYELVPYSDHHKLTHVGGNKVWGNKYAEAIKRLPYNREIIQTAQRWGKFVALDLAFSSVSLAITGEDSYASYFMNFVASTSAGMVAWGMESVLITAFPLLQGGTPLFIGRFMLPFGGPASWMASGAYFATRFVIMHCWNEMQQREAMEIEKRCKIAERQARVSHLNKLVRYNSEKLLTLVPNVCEAE